MAYITALNADSVPEFQRDVSPLCITIIIQTYPSSSWDTQREQLARSFLAAGLELEHQKAGSNANGLHVRCRRLGNGTSQISSLQSPVSNLHVLADEPPLSLLFLFDVWVCSDWRNLV